MDDTTPEVQITTTTKTVTVVSGKWVFVTETVARLDRKAEPYIETGPNEPASPPLFTAEC